MRYFLVYIFLMLSVSPSMSANVTLEDVLLSTEVNKALTKGKIKEASDLWKKIKHKKTKETWNSIIYNKIAKNPSKQNCRIANEIIRISGHSSTSSSIWKRKLKKKGCDLD